MSTTHPAALADEQLLADCEVRRQRVRGPGGQHRNKVETGIALTHVPSGIQATASERRSQAENRQAALFRLRLRLAVQIRTPMDQRTPSPSPLWQSRCQGRSLRVNVEHRDFPTLLAEALDAVAAAEFDLAPAADHLKVSPSQLARFLQQESEAWQQVNAERRQRGLRPLAR